MLRSSTEKLKTVLDSRLWAPVRKVINTKIIIKEKQSTEISKVQAPLNPTIVQLKFMQINNKLKSYQILPPYNKLTVYIVNEHYKPKCTT
jgi:hypothetical protein